MASNTIVIVGGGFAGTSLAMALEKRLPPGWRALLISEESYTTFNPMLAEVVGAAVFPLLCSLIASICRGADPPSAMLVTEDSRSLFQVPPLKTKRPPRN